MSSDQPRQESPTLWMAAYGSLTFLRNIQALLSHLPAGDPRASGRHCTGEGIFIWGPRAVVEEWVSERARGHLRRE